MTESEPEDAAEESAAGAAVPRAVLPVPRGVIDPELYRLTMAVVFEMDSMVTEYLVCEGYRYLPYRDTRRVKAFDSGWPSVSMKERDESRIAHKDLFARKVTAINPFAYDDIRSMAALKEYVNGNEAWPYESGRRTLWAQSLPAWPRR